MPTGEPDRDDEARTQFNTTTTPPMSDHTVVVAAAPPRRGACCGLCASACSLCWFTVRAAVVAFLAVIVMRAYYRQTVSPLPHVIHTTVDDSELERRVVERVREELDRMRLEDTDLAARALPDESSSLPSVHIATNCHVYDVATGDCYTFFDYENTGDAPHTIPVGPHNFVGELGKTGVDALRTVEPLGQPTTFGVGRHERAFRVRWRCGGPDPMRGIVWHVDGLDVTETSESAVVFADGDAIASAQCPPDTLEAFDAKSKAWRDASPHDALNWCRPWVDPSTNEVKCFGTCNSVSSDDTSSLCCVATRGEASAWLSADGATTCECRECTDPPVVAMDVAHPVRFTATT